MTSTGTKEIVCTIDSQMNFKQSSNIARNLEATDESMTNAMPRAEDRGFNQIAA